MADLMFTAGLDDRQFRQGLRGVDRQTRTREREEKRASDRSANILKNGSRLLLGAAGIGLVRKMWREAGEAVEEYGKKNMYAARGVAEIERSVDRVGTAIGRSFTGALLAAKGPIDDISAYLAGAVEYWHDTIAMDFFGASRSPVEKMKQQEEATRLARQASLTRDIGGPMEAQILRLRGLGGQADIIEAENRYKQLNERLNDMQQRGEIDGDTRLRLGITGRNLRDLQVQDAMRSEVRSFTGATPRQLRFAVSGGVDNQTRERIAEKAAKEAAQQRARQEAQLKRIARNTARGRVAQYGP